MLARATVRPISEVLVTVLRRSSLTPGAPDITDNHYLVLTNLFCYWSKEVNNNISTVEQPSLQFIITLCKWRDRSHKKTEAAMKTEEQSASATATSTTSALLNTFLITQLAQMNQQRLSSSAIPSSLPEYFAPTSSPIYIEKDPQDLLAEFFDWLIKQPGCNNKQKIEL